MHRRAEEVTVDIIVEQPPDRDRVVVYLYAAEAALTPAEAREVGEALLKAADLTDGVKQ